MDFSGQYTLAPFNTGLLSEAKLGECRLTDRTPLRPGLRRATSPKGGGKGRGAEKEGAANRSL